VYGKVSRQEDVEGHCWCLCTCDVWSLRRQQFTCWWGPLFMCCIFGK